MAGHIHFVTGGARSGKSRYAQGLAEASSLAPVFIATAEPGDAEMTARIARHRAERDARWTVVEAPLALAEAIEQAGGADRILLVDCLTLWASNLLLRDADDAAAIDRLEAALGRLGGPVILVSNEVGLGIVPDNALARRFRDLAGTINQRVAGIADRATLVVAGLPLSLKN